MKVLTFGEIMLRLKALGHERFFQSPMLEATFGGGEANVAVSLANYGMDAEFLTVLPQNDIAAIAQAVGYESQSRFTAAFKETYGELPTEYRRKRS